MQLITERNGKYQNGFSLAVFIIIAAIVIGATIGVLIYQKQNTKPLTQELFSQKLQSSQIEQKAVDFTPPTGKTNGPGANGPWAMRLISAISKDGLNFQRTNQVITDQGDVEDGQGSRTYYAEGKDGINFTKMGVAFSQSGKHVLDPSTLQTPSCWHLFAGGNGPGKGWHATSKDGKTFTSGGYKEFIKDSRGYIFANAIVIPGGYRAYAFDNKSIVSFLSKDGENWTAEDGVRLTLNHTSGYETGVLKDPAVVQLPDGSFLMVYVTKIP